MLVHLKIRCSQDTLKVEPVSRSLNRPALHRSPHAAASRTWLVRTVGEMASGGSGSMISTLVAVLRSLNWLRALTRYSVRLRLCFSTMHSTQISGLMF